MSATSNKDGSEPIAVIGIACRFPGGANTPSKLWDLLQSPHDLSEPVPASRFNAASYFHPDGTYHGATDCQKAYFIQEDITQFDNAFFNISSNEAEAIDPQQRVLLETVYDSLSNAGQRIEDLRGSNAGVYVGLMCDDWAQLNGRDWDLVPTYSATGTSRAVFSNRISYFFDWHGPSITIDTACSSSLVAVHQAMSALRSGESPIAVAAGANLILSPGMWIAESNLHMLSPTGSSKMWDAGADGYARGEGVAAIVMKPLSAALRDGDQIECIIRATGVNQDGRTPGLTMPSNSAQAALIRDTYARAGLDITDPRDHPQYFHAHGTGTPAGDPQEAEAISTAFSSARSGSKEVSDPLYVGSIKTVIGHTEGTAGLASLIGTALAMKHGVIPPNLHFDTVSPKVEPFYKNLCVPTQARQWPKPADGQPLRASINSFGFGGTNAHAIIENYKPTAVPAKEKETAFAPLTFSAGSPSALRQLLVDLQEHLMLNPDVSARDLAFSLYERRSTLPYRKAIVCENTEMVVANIENLLNNASGDDLSTRYPDSFTPNILGVFTGQGAQWARMGAHLLERSPFVVARLAELDATWETLPSHERPSWTLREQILADKASSRVGEAAISQPLCTAVQIILVDLLRAAGIKLGAVVGHSSGEIGCAYATGLLSATDALRVAYYRGFHAKLAKSPNEGESKGAMMAVGTTYEDALEFCALDEFEGRLQVAARNSPTSLTLSGDESAVEEALAIFADEGKFARRLLVDTAYHSRHMDSCAKSYLESLINSNLKIEAGNGTQWFSSVYENRLMSGELIQDSTYWVANMTNAVLFAPAVASAAEKAGPFDLGIEVGPHPALKAPAMDSLKQVSSQPIPYTGLLSRGKDDVNELGSALGFVWANCGSKAVNLRGFEETISASSTPLRFVADLPFYPFDHSRSFLRLSRFSGAAMANQEAPNPIIGRRLVESETVNEVSWRNILRSSEISWLQGHALQGQSVFAAMGYVSMAVEAVASVAGPARELGSINLHDVEIGRALAFNDEQSGMETKVTLRITDISEQQLLGEFSCYSGAPHGGAAPLELNFKAGVAVSFEEPRPDTLPAVRADEINLSDTPIDRLYTQFNKLGYNYNDPFTGVRSIQRKSGFASGEIEDTSGTAWEDELLVHPGWLDSALQTCFAAYSCPQDNRLWSLHVPTSIKSITINPYYTSRGLGGRSRNFQYQTFAIETPSAPVVADIDVFAGANNKHPFVSIEGVEVRPFATATARDDVTVFTSMDYRLGNPDGDAIMDEEIWTPKRILALDTAERVGFFYVRRMYETLTDAEKEAALPHYKRFLEFTERLIGTVREGKHPNVPKEAIDDTTAFVRSLMTRCRDSIDIQLLEAAGENLIPEIRRNGSILEHVLKDNLLDRFYEESDALQYNNVLIGRMVAQIGHRYPGLRVLEVGAGTGGATSHILPALDNALASYTYTDVSAGFFNRVQERFRDYIDRMTFATFDMEKAPGDQGLEEGSYDVVVASNVLHATGDLNAAISGVRKLLRPGGYLVPLEILSNYSFGIDAVMGALPGWWAGAEVESWRRDGPSLNFEQWTSLVQRHGFSGVDTHTPMAHKLQAFSVFACQAIDPTVQTLRKPLEAPLSDSPQHLVIVGGRKPAVSQLVDQVREILKPRYATTVHLTSLEELETQSFALGSTVLSLTELDEPYLQELTPSKLEALKLLSRNSRNILWVTQDARATHPYSGMMMGLCRVIRYEQPNTTLQVFDIESIPATPPTTLAEALIRLEIGKQVADDPDKDILWSIEPEIHLQNGKEFVPRLLPHVPANARYNSVRRPIRDTVNTQTTKVGLTVNPSNQPELQVLSPLVGSAPADDDVPAVRIEVQFSTLQGIRTLQGLAQLCIGKDKSNNKHIAALVPSGSVTSTIDVPTVCTTRLTSPPNAAFVTQLANLLLARIILGSTSSRNEGTVLIHDANEPLRNALAAEAATRGLQLVFTTGTASLAKKASDANQPIFVHERLPRRLIQRIVPRDVTALVDLSVNDSSVVQLLRSFLPSSAQKFSVSDFLRTEVDAQFDSDDHEIQQLLKSAVTAAGRHASRRLGQEQAYVVDITQIKESTLEKNALQIVDWTNSGTVEANVRPIDSAPIFRADGTYWLLGLAGDLGQSLCQWMVHHGARNVVLSSRNPKVHPRTFEALESYGADIRVEAVDITDRASLQQCYDRLQAEMPPIIGVANGALILEDVLFGELEFESLQRTMPCKVDGSTYLDELFYDTPLDFFIMFTSVANVVGNSGQATYVMGNSYMVSLAQQRRDQRGVPGSAIAISSLQGVGYITREGFAADHFDRLGYRNVSEQDVQVLFAEAILAGQPGSTRHVEVVSGIQPFQEGPTTHIQLKTDVKFQHLRIRENDGAGNGQDLGGGSGVKPRVRLATVTSRDEAVEVLHEAFIGRLRRILMMPATESIDPSVSLVELGADSIMAVDVRAWFLKELEVDIPVLKILGANETVGGLVDEALEKIPKDILDLDNLGKGGSGDKPKPKTKTAPPAAPAAPVKTQPPVQTPVPTTVATSTATPRSSSTARTVASDTSAESAEVDQSESALKAKESATQAAQSMSRRSAIVGASTEHTEQMTFGQNRFWFLNHYVDEATTFNIAYMAKLRGRIDVPRLTRALQTVAQRHETLRTRYYWSEDKTRTPMQGILSKPLIQLEMGTVDSDEQASKELDAMREHEWDFGDWVPLRMRLLSKTGSSDEHFIVVGTHHISMDGHSFSVLMLDLQRVYSAGPGQPPLPPLTQASQARGFGAKQRLAVNSGKLRPALEHFRKVLSGADLTRPIELFPFAHTQGIRPPLDKYATHVAKAHLDANTTAQIKQIARQHRVTGFHAFLGALQAYLFRVLPEDTTRDVFIGLADANRIDADSMSAIGNFLNVLPVRFEREQRQTFREAMERARDHANSALRHSALPFDVLLNELDVPRSTSWAPVFQIFLDYRLVVKDQSQKKWINCKIENENWHTARSGYDVAIEIVDSADGAMIAVHVQQALYGAEAAQLIVKSYVNFLKQLIARGGEVQTRQLEKWDPSDVKDALVKGSGAQMKLEWPATATDRIDQVIAHNAEKPALKDGYGKSLTYRAMDQRIDALAAELRPNLLSAGDEQPIVGVMQRPSADWMCSMLAIFRCGAIYLPLDMRNGTPRLRSNVQSARPHVILADSHTIASRAEVDPAGRTPFIDVSTLPDTPATQYERVASDPDASAYIIFSSGSTGEPKGIVVQHAGLRANLEGYHRGWKIEQLAHVVLQQTALSFDASLVQVFAALTTGGCLVVAPAEARGDPAEITALMVKQGVTMTQATPSEYEMWFRFAPETLHQCKTWRAAWFGGERAAGGLLDGFRAARRAIPELQVFTSYGPTETTISATKGEVNIQDPNVQVPVAMKLLPNYNAYIVDEERKPQPIGVPGEILVGGLGVGGNIYLHQPEMTLDTFLKDTLSPLAGHGRMYRTGDFGRLDTQGRLTVEGRIAGDTQVKLRGFRIELGEIERVMMVEAAGALSAVIMTRREAQDDRGPFLVAHVVLDKAYRGQQDELVSRLHARLPLRLPQYMCPAIIVVLDDMPLTSHQKVDRRAVQALPLPEVSKDAAQQISGNLSPLERRLAAIWDSLLPFKPADSPPLDRDSDFFRMGGNSLLLVKLQSKIKAEFNDAPRLNRLMSAPTLASMAALLTDIASDKVNWDREMELDQALSTITPPSSLKRTDEGLVVLLTGATGSLAGRLLRRLAADSRIAQIWCLTRNAEDRTTTDLFGLESSKIHVLSTALPSLPGSDVLPSKIDIICHAAADRNFWDTFSAVRGVNFEAAKTLAELSLRTGAVLHVLSSGAVAKYESESDAESLPRPSPDQGYVASKWITERYLARVAKTYPSAQITAHRPGPPARQGQTADNDHDELVKQWIADMQRISLAMGVRPDFARVSGNLSLTRLDRIADDVAAVILPGGSGGKRSEELQVVQHHGLAQVAVETLHEKTEELFRADAEYAALPTTGALHWVGEAKKARLFEWFFTAQDLVVREGEQEMVTRR